MQGIKLNRKCILILKNKISLSKRDFQIIIEPPEAPTEGRYSNLWNEGGQRFMRNRSSKWSLFVSWRHTTLQWLSTILSRLAFHFLSEFTPPNIPTQNDPSSIIHDRDTKDRQILAPRLIKGQKGPLLAPILVWELAGFLLASLAPNRLGTSRFGIEVALCQVFRAEVALYFQQFKKSESQKSKAGFKLLQKLYYMESAASTKIFMDSSVWLTLCMLFYSRSIFWTKHN